MYAAYLCSCVAVCALSFLALPTVEAGCGYFYPKPERVVKLEPISNASSTMGNGTVVQADYIDDIIMAQKEQILSAVFNGANRDPNSVGGGGGTGDSNKAFLVNRCAPCTCGVPNVQRIVGGNNVRTNKYPWTAQLIRNGFFFCGGSLINDRYVLTAAHCVYDFDNKELFVRLLQVDRSSPTDLGITRRVVSVRTHMGYNPTTLINDIAMLRFDQPVLLLDPIRPVCLPSGPFQNFDYRPAVVAGWGLSQESGSTSPVLQEVTVPVISNAQCRATTYKSMIVDTMLCAGYIQTGGKDACQGDSGGPLIVKERIYRLAGVVSFGYGCAQPNAPGVYTRVSRYLDWISSLTRDACYCIY